MMVRPAGSAGDTVNVLVPVTVEAVNAVVAASAVPTTPVMDWVAGVITGTEVMVRRIVAMAELVPSAAVTT